ncbi:MAG: type II toxin-antitoxin system RatA family toxin [Gammaproteobacteria bacterium]
MPKVIRDVAVPHGPRDMFDLVNDIERYPEFLPWCDGASILSRDDNVVTASLLLSRSGVQSRFSTRNRNVEDRQIEIELLDGPFDHLRGRWTFEPVAKKTRVALELRYRFSNPLLGLVLGGVVEDVATELVDAFRLRAIDVYA